MSLIQIKNGIVDVPDFPKKDILFKDITPILESPKVFKLLIEEMGRLIPASTTKLVGIESRGFILASALAFHTGKGLVLCRKPGKLPRETFKVSYDLEYGTDTLELHKSSLEADDKIVIVDDVLATGGTAQAAEELCGKSGCEILSFLFLMELQFLGGRKKLDRPVESLIAY